MNLAPIYETPRHYVIQTPKGFEVYANGTVAARRVATIGFAGAEGIRRAIAEINRREGAP